MKARVGVVIPCKNEAATIEACLRALTAQNPKIETILVMDNGSTDGSRDMAAQYARVVDYSEKGLGRMRNVGASMLGDVDVIGFIDADCEVGPLWLSSGLEALNTNDMVGSRTMAAPDAPWVARRWAAIERSTQTDESLLWSQHLLIRRETFERIGGFDEELHTNEDSALSASVKNAGGTIGFVPDMDVVHHGFANTIPAFVRRELWHTSTPGWFERMSPKSQALVLAAGMWGCLGMGAAVTALSLKRPRLFGAWTLLTAAGVPGIGLGVTRTPRTSFQDGALLSCWALARSASLVSQVTRPSSQK